jgi:transposase InsO family protein
MRWVLLRFLAIVNRYHQAAPLRTLSRIWANHKRVVRLMRADNLLAVRKRQRVFTTDSRHGYAACSNLSRATDTH